VPGGAIGAMQAGLIAPLRASARTAARDPLSAEGAAAR
jgi:hypothetical protein